MFSFKRILSLVLVLSLALLVMAGCKTDPDPVPRFGPKVTGAEFSGTWKSSDDEYISIDISAKTVTSSFSNTPSFGMDSWDWKGNIVGEVLDDMSLLQSKWGYLIIEVTDAGLGSTEFPSAYSAGKYLGYHWKNLTASTVDGSTQYKSGSANNGGMDSAAEAESEYTADNGYFGMSSTYAKQ
ncbi:hypothetical protein AGMMS50293_08900 [Spirochaetia bacterium]|nr:hypothetical protein AGMMS50293_08900 [Spirochaetia bacterium]